MFTLLADYPRSLSYCFSYRCLLSVRRDDQGSNIVERIRSSRICCKHAFTESVAEIGNYFRQKKNLPRKGNRQAKTRAQCGPHPRANPGEDLPRFAQADRQASLLDRSSKPYLCWSCTILRAKGRGTSWYRVRINIAPSPLSLCLPSINCPIQRGRLPRRTNCSTEIGNEE